MNHNFNMGPISAFPMTPSTPAITISAAGDAARELKRAKSSSGRPYATSRANEERLKRRSNRMAQEFQGAMEKSVKRKLNSMSGSQNNRKLGLKVAQFIPGKGLEVAGAQVENDPAIYCSLGIKGEKHVDPLEETFTTIKGRQVSMDFAFKLVNPVDKLLDHDKDTRITALNCFRHVNPKSFDYTKTGWSKDITGSSGVVSSVTVTNGGSFSSTSGVAVQFTGGGGSGAVAVIRWVFVVGSGNVIDAIDVTDGGSGYTSVPTVTITNNYSGAAATAAVDYSDYTLAKANYDWHITLGPDASLIRVGDAGATQGQSTLCGTWRGQRTAVGYGTLDPETNAAANTLMSPYRYPRDMEVMYSRVNRQLIENYGWLLNPFKFINPSANSKIDSPDPKRDALKVWSNPGKHLLDFTDVSSVNARISSYPAQINKQTDDVKAQQGLSSAGEGYEWHSQFGPGKLNYQFSNDGTNPVCIDICVVGVKKDSPVSVDLLKSFCSYNYAMHKYANKNATNVNGYQSGVVDPTVVDLTLGQEEWHKNAKLPFMPDECFKNPPSYLNAADIDFGSGAVYATVFNQLEQGKKNPFKVIKRDQFIVSSGSSRSWNTTLPSIKYRPQLYDDVSYPFAPSHVPGAGDLVTTVDEYTFVLCIGASGMPKPVEEVYSTTKPISIDSNGDPVDGVVDTKTIIDRQPSTCNVSVVGTYKETVYPSFPKDRTSVNFINGRLTEPYFETPPGVFEPNSNTALNSRVNTVDIAQLGQVVQVAENGVIGVGALNTEIGA